MERLKQLLAEPSPENWDAICAELEGVSDEEELREMVAVCVVGLEGWPDGLRTLSLRFPRFMGMLPARSHLLFSLNSFFQSDLDLESFLNSKSAVRRKAMDGVRGDGVSLAFQFLKVPFSTNFWYATVWESSRISLIRISKNGDFLLKIASVPRDEFLQEGFFIHSVFLLSENGELVEWGIESRSVSRDSAQFKIFQNEEALVSKRVHGDLSCLGNGWWAVSADHGILFWNCEIQQLEYFSPHRPSHTVHIEDFRPPVRIFPCSRGTVIAFSGLGNAIIVDATTLEPVDLVTFPVESEYPPVDAQINPSKSSMLLFQPWQQDYTDINNWTNYWGGVYFYVRNRVAWQTLSKIEFSHPVEGEMTYCSFQWQEEPGFAYVHEDPATSRLMLHVPSLEINRTLDQGEYLEVLRQIEWQSDPAGLLLFFDDRVVFLPARINP